MAELAGRTPLLHPFAHGRGVPCVDSAMELLRHLRLPVFALLWGLACAGALAQPAQLAHLEGSAALAPQGEQEWLEAQAGRALQAGDRLWTDAGARLELKAGRHLLRADARSRLAIDRLQAGDTQLSLRQGSLQARVPALGERENLEIGTPNLAFRATAPGRFRIDVDAQRGVTQVSVLEGRGTVFGAGGEQRVLQAGQDMAFAGRALAIAAPVRTGPPDAFERWAVLRDRAQAPPVLARGPAPRVARAPAARPPTARAPTPAPAQAMGAGPTRPAEGSARRFELDEHEERWQQQRRRAELAAREAWLRQRRAAEEQLWRQQQEWLRYQHGGPPPRNGPAYPLTPRGGIPARRVG